MREGLSVCSGGLPLRLVVAELPVCMGLSLLYPCTDVSRAWPLPESCSGRLPRLTKLLVSDRRERGVPNAPKDSDSELPRVAAAGSMGSVVGGMGAGCSGAPLPSLPSRDEVSLPVASR